MMTSPTFTRPLNDMARDINSHVKIGCSLNVEATVEWFKDTKRLKTATKEKKKEHWLTIKSMSVADCGKYLCRCESAVTSCNLTLRDEDIEDQEEALSYAELQTRLREMKKTERDKSAHVEVLMKEKEDLQKTITELKQNMAEHKDEVEKARREMAHLTKQIDTLKEKINKLKSDISLDEFDLQKRDKQLDDERKRISLFFESQKKLELERKKENDTMKNDFTGYMETMKKEIRRLQEEKEEAERARTDIEDSIIQALQREIQGLKDKMENEKTRLENDKTEAIRQTAVAETELTYERSQTKELLRQQQESIPKKKKDCKIS